MANEMLKTCPTFEPTTIPILPGCERRALVLVPCLTSTPFGTPVLPCQASEKVEVESESNIPDVYIAYTPSSEVTGMPGLIGE
jgi:hypothetical protein